MSKELETLTKLLAITTSSNDAEALVAIRKANAMLAGRNMTWELFIKGKYPRADINTSGRGEDGDWPTSGVDPEEINQMFNLVLANASGSFITFIESIHDWWEEKGFLTDRQFNALKNAYERAQDRR